MAEYSQDKSAPGRARNFPGWVVEQMISLCEFAESQGFTEFEAKLGDATEALLDEFQAKQLGSHQSKTAQVECNVIPFPRVPRKVQ